MPAWVSWIRLSPLPGVEIRREDQVVCSARWIVGREHIAQHLAGRGRNVLSTPCLILFMEATARMCLDELLGDGRTSVGYRVDVKHRKSVGLGEEVLVEARVGVFDGRRALFLITARNSSGEVIGEGLNERYVVEG